MPVPVVDSGVGRCILSLVLTGPYQLGPRASRGSTCRTLPSPPARSPTAPSPSTRSCATCWPRCAPPSSRPTTRDPLRARADGDVRRLARHRAPGDRVPRRRGRCCAGSTARAPSSPGPACESHLHLASFTQDMRRRGLTPVDPGHAGRRGSAAGRGRARALGLGAGAAAWRLDRVRLADGRADGASRTAGTRSRCCPASTGHDLGGSLYELFAEDYGLPSTPPSRRCGARPPTRASPAGSTSPVAHPAPGLPPRLGRSRRPPARARRLPLPRRPLPAAHVPGQHAAPGPPRHHTKGHDHEHSRRAAAGDRAAEAVQPRAAPEVRPQPHAARSRPCPSRRCCCGWASPTCSAPTASAGTRSPPSSAPPATRSSPTCRCSSPSASRSAWPRRPTARRRWPPSSATSSSRASATRCRRFVLGLPGRGRGPGADQLRRARRHRHAA